MRNSKLLIKSILIPTLGISAIGTIATVCTSCGNEVHVTRVELNKTSTTLAVGKTEILTANVLPKNAINKDVAWTSSNPAVATVENGTITAKKLGETTITVTSVDNPNAKATCEVNVDISSYVAITANEDSTLTFKHEYVGSFPDLQYSTDGGTNWSPYSTTININQGQSLYLKGNNPAGWSSSASAYSTLSITGDVSIFGNVMALLDNGAETAKTIPCDYCFYSLFDSPTGITSVSKNFLPATTLANNCYQNMFYGCSSLTTAPILPATTLTENCYRAMFGFCSSLTTVPNLPATTLATECCRFMFQGCSSLTTAPDLPATTLTDWCYYGMFYDCSSLTTAPNLPATTLADLCYFDMFYGCSSLTTAPDLPATTLTDRCYWSMFEGCSSLTTAPILPATSLVNWCYYGMFRGCSSLITAPALPASWANGCYRSMFENCTSLNSIKIGYTGTYNSNCFNNWVYGVASSGTFYYNGSQTAQEFQFPEGWTVEHF